MKLVRRVTLALASIAALALAGGARWRIGWGQPQEDFGLNPPGACMGGLTAFLP